MKPFPVLSRLALLAVTALLSLASVHAQDTSNNSEKMLSSYRDKNRVLLIFAPTAQDPAYLEQTKFCQSEKSGFDERQLVVFPVLADSKKPAGDGPGTLAKKFGVDPKNFMVILLGKDGHDAYRSARPVPAATLYGTVDAMPMRRLEMKRQQAASASPTPRATPAKPDLDHDD